MSFRSPRLRVGVVGATGAVGQKFVRLLDGHPWFELTTLVASERSAGRRYRDAVRWLEPCDVPPAAAGMLVTSLEADLDVDLVFSALDATLARAHEPRLAARFPVISNASAFREVPDVPVVVPEVNGDHLALARRQRFGAGYLVTVPNCSSVGLSMVLKPLLDAFGVRGVHVTTLQAASGAGYPGVPSLDLLANVVPFIAGEEDKIAREPLKILGRLTDRGVEPADLRISAHVHRVPVIDGHLLALSIGLDRRTRIDAIVDALRSSRPTSRRPLPSAPAQDLHVFDREDFPQPRLHATLGNGMTVSVGRVRECPILDVRLVALVHNTMRGAAGNAILIAEDLVERGMVAVRAENREAARPA